MKKPELGISQEDFEAPEVLNIPVNCEKLARSVKEKIKKTDLKASGLLNPFVLRNYPWHTILHRKFLFLVV